MITIPAGGIVWDFAHDAKGNQTRKGSQLRTFDGANRITAIGGDAYACDGHGRRVATWQADGGTKVEVYTRDGKLGFVVDSEKGGASSYVYLASQRLQQAGGVGLITATALSASIGHFDRSPSGRHFASALGLTPREHSSGTTRRLGHTTKRGDVDCDHNRLSSYGSPDPSLICP